MERHVVEMLRVQRQLRIDVFDPCAVAAKRGNEQGYCGYRVAGTKTIGGRSGALEDSTARP